MRRNIEEIKSEIMRRKGEYKVRQARFWRTIAVSAASCAACLALVFYLTTRPVPGRTIDANAAGTAAEQSADAATDRPAAAAEDYQYSGTVNWNMDASTGGAAATDEPKEGVIESAGSDGIVDPGSPGPWICGTPALEGEELSLDGLMNLGLTYDGASAPSLARTTVAFVGDEVQRFTFEGEDGRNVLELVTNTLREAGLQPAPVDPEEPECGFVVYFEFMSADGNISHARVGFTADGFVLINNEYCWPTLPEGEVSALRAALEGLCR